LYLVAERTGKMKNIYVGNLPFGATEDDLRQAFEAFGEVSGVSIITDRETGRSRGFAFVEMPNDDEAAEAIKNLNLADIGGRNVTVNEARPRAERSRGRRGGGRRY
jgi:RNA recognition motif-containing protein